MRGIALLVAALILASSVINGLRQGPRLLGEAANTAQLVVAVGQILYAGAALLALIGLWRRQAWTLPVAAVWAVATTAVAAVASVAWSDAGIGTALLAGLVTAILAGWVVWFTWYLRRNPGP
jgi:hypothetical protein